VSAKLLEYETCRPDGQLIASNFTINEQTGTITLCNLSITKKGMYLISFSIITNHSKSQSFNCSSKTILVKHSNTFIRTEKSEPNIVLTFDGNPTHFDRNLDKYKLLIYNCLINQYDLTLNNEIIFRANETKFFLTANGSLENKIKLFSSLRSNFSFSNELILKSAIINQQEFKFNNTKNELYIIQPSDSRINENVTNKFKIRENGATRPLGFLCQTFS
jgi:hypothetical protein